MLGDPPPKLTVDPYSATWLSLEAFLKYQIKDAQEALEKPRETGLERIDQGRIGMCRDILRAARPSAPENERSPVMGVDYGLQGSRAEGERY